MSRSRLHDRIHHTAAEPNAPPARQGSAALGRHLLFNGYVLKRLFTARRLRKVMVERLNEPLHMNAAALAVALVGSFRRKVDFDLVIRPQYAFPILYAADLARRYGLPKITIAEFGVANGAGLINMCKIAASVRAETGVDIDVVGFDTGTGMPEGLDYRDHPEAFQPGDFPMDIEKLKGALPSFASLSLGPIGETVPAFLRSLSSQRPLAFVSIDVDYYSSSAAALQVFDGPADIYMPRVLTYLDDIAMDEANPWCGELLAVAEFNAAHPLRKIAPFPALRAKRLFKNALWIEQVYVTQIFDHPTRSFAFHERGQVYAIENEYIS